MIADVQYRRWLRNSTSSAKGSETSPVPLDARPWWASVRGDEEEHTEREGPGTPEHNKSTRLSRAREGDSLSQTSPGSTRRKSLVGNRKRNRETPSA